MKVLIFGSSGSLGAEIVTIFSENSWDVYGVSRGNPAPGTLMLHENFLENVKKIGRLDAVVFAQGKNTNDSITDSAGSLGQPSMAAQGFPTPMNAPTTK
jgi:dTDP-4-dehydrorhamnose reductase